jgi:hypothetical protein
MNPIGSLISSIFHKPQPTATPASGTATGTWHAGGSLPIPPAVRALVDKASDGFDSMVGMDPRGGKPITLTGVKGQDYVSMESKVAQLEKAELPMDASTRAKLEKGEIVSSWRPAGDGRVEELTQGLVDVPLETFLKRMPAKDWGKNLSDWKGGEVKPDGDGRQIERMVMRMPGKDLDMTKVETISDMRDEKGALTGARVRWEVLKSDNGTVVTDTGTLRFERYGDKTLVTWHSAHKLDKFPLVQALAPKMAADAATGAILTDFFARQIQQYRQVAGG